MHSLQKVLIVVATVAVALGLLLILAQTKHDPVPAVAAGIEASNELPEHFAVMLELVPTFLAVQRVQMLNLVNGLFLTDEQLDEMISYLSELQRLEQQVAGLKPKLQKHSAELARARELLAEVEAVLVTGGQPSPDLEGEVNRLTTKLLNVFGDFSILDEETKAFKVQAHGAFYNLLTDNQKILVQEYVECIIPLEGDPMNPERIGEAGPGMVDQLKELRAMDDTQYALARDHIVNELWQSILQHCPDEQKGATAEKKRIAAVLDEIREMDGTEFSLAGDELTEMVLPYEAHEVFEYDGDINEEVVRERIWKYFIENINVDLLIEYRNQR